MYLGFYREEETLDADARKFAVVWWVAAAALFVVTASVLATRMNASDNDAVQYLVGARNLWETGDPYAASATALELSTTEWVYCYPPALAFVWLPLAGLSAAAASQVWLVVNFALTLVLAWQIAALVPLKPRGSVTAATCLLLLVYPPQTLGMMIGQCHVLLAVAIVASYDWARAGRETLAGFALALAISLKLFPALLLFAFWAVGWRRAAVTAAIATAGWMLMTFPLQVDYVQQYVLGSFYPHAAAFNVSIVGMAHRLFENTDYAVAVVDLTLLRRSMVLGGVGVVLASLAWLCTRRAPQGVLFAAHLCGMLLIAPIAGFYHLNLALVALAACAPRLIASLGARRFAIIATAVFLLTAIPPELGLAEASAPWARAVYHTTHTGWGTLLLTPPTYGLALLLGACLLACRKRGLRST